MIAERSSEKLECTLNPQQSSAVRMLTLSAIMVALCLSLLFSFQLYCFIFTIL